MNSTDTIPGRANHEQDLQRVVDFFESISRDSTRELAAIYTADAYFKDPFNEVRGLPAITAIFSHMFDQVDTPRFFITTRVLQGDNAFIAWDFSFRMKRFNQDEQCIHGATQIHFDDRGRVDMHRDFWDAAEELYEKLPLLGGFMRLLKRAARQ